MIIRTFGINAASEDCRMGNVTTLLDFLGMKKDAVGIHTISGDVELIASVPFQMRSEKGEVSNEQEGFSWVLSTFDLDRFGERIDPAGWDFKRYMDNPVVEWAHRYDIPAIGKVEGLTIDDEGLHGLVFFNDKFFDPFGWSIGQRVKAGVIRAGSVGFRVMEIEIPSKEDSKDGTSLIFRKQELLEFSICNVPANPAALVKADALTKGIGNGDWGMGNKNSGNNTSPFWGSIINSLQE